MDRGLLEGLAVEFYERHTFDPSTPIAIGRLARAELGDGCIERGMLLYGADERVFWQEGRQRIAIRRGLSDAYARHRIAHGLSHVILGDYREEDLESCCDYLGAALMCPAPAVRALYRVFGSDFAAIADEIGATQTQIALRLAEVRGVARVVLTPKRIYDRLPESWIHPTAAEFRSLERSKRPGLTKTRITDATGRIAIDVEETG